jgi:hypothetical protein
MQHVLQNLKGIISPPPSPGQKRRREHVYSRLYQRDGCHKENMNTQILNRTLSWIKKCGFKRIALLFAIFLWAIYSYSTGNRLLGALILVFIFLLLSSIPYVVPVAALVIMLILFQTPLLNTGSAIIQSYTSVLGNPGQALSNLFTPGAGQAGLPPQARRAISLLEARDIERYRLSNLVLEDPLISQRITEMAWPRRIDESSPYLILFLKEEQNYPACTIIEKKKDVALEHCP